MHRHVLPTERSKNCVGGFCTVAVVVVREGGGEEDRGERGRGDKKSQRDLNKTAD